MKRPQVVVGMSGGVDSSVAAALLLRDGHRVTGITMRTWGGAEPDREVRRHGCYGPGEEQEIRQAREVASRIGIEHRVLDLTRDYRQYVLDYFRDEYLAGRTPNPCVRCNRTVKFGALLSRARASGLAFERFATGHYAQVARDEESDRYLLRKGRDRDKDQSYFLSALTQEQLALCLFPLGTHTKARVRRMAGEFGLGLEARAESQDFADGGPGTLFGTEPRPGPILDQQGGVVGQHRGIHRYTVGQRRGLGVAHPEPLYVLAIDAKKNSLVVGPREAVLGRTLIARDLNWIAIPPPEEPLTLSARVRYRHAEAPADVVPLPGGEVRVRFREPQLAITPGQTVVFYDGDLVVGAGTIARQEG